MIIELLQYDFIIRAMEAGVLVALIAPMIGMFLVLRRYALLADTLSHVSLAGVAVGLLLQVNPIATAIGASGVAAILMERLRSSKRLYGDTTLSIFLSGSLALAIILIGLANGFNVNLFGYLFGSILTVKTADLLIIATLGCAIILFMLFLYKELVYISFDEEAAAVSGLPVRSLNLMFVTFAAIAVALAIPIVGVLLISALMVIPVVAALQLKKSFRDTLLWAEGISVLSMLAGIFLSFSLDLPPAGTIVLLMLVVLIGIFLLTQRRKK